MNKLIPNMTRSLRSLTARVVLASILASVFCLTSSAMAAPTQFNSSNFGIESIIFGGTGVLRSSQGSTPPVITAGPTVGSILTTSAVIQWTTDKQTNSVVFIGSESGNYEFQTGQIAETTFTSHTVKVGQLKKGTKYFYKVRSSDLSGNQVESSEKSFVTDPGDVTPPKVTKGPFIANNSASSVTVTWETDELSNTIVEYGVRAVTESSAGSPEELTQFHQVTVSSLQSAQTYLLRIKSKDSSDNTYVGQAQQVTTLDSPSITEVRITDITLNSAIVQWRTTTPSSSTITYGTSSAYGENVDDAATVENHLVRLTSLQSGTTYYLRIKGQDQAGNKLQSDEYVFKTVILPTITDFSISEVSPSSALLSWKSSSPIDELVRGEITKTSDTKLKGKRISGGTDTLVTEHSYLLSDLESSTEYTVSVAGKDVFGNQAISSPVVFQTLVDNIPPEIQNLQTDTTVDLGSKQSVQVLVSFGLSEPGTSVIEYGIGATGDYDKKITTDTELSTNKFMVIPGLEPGQTYHARIRAKDRAGNETVSADILVLAPTKQASILDLIGIQISNNFGWLARLGR